MRLALTLLGTTAAIVLRVVYVVLRTYDEVQREIEERHYEY